MKKEKKENPAQRAKRLKVPKPTKLKLESTTALQSIKCFKSDLYSKADDLKKERLLSNNFRTPDSILELIKEEIDVRIGITQQEIFFIGELLAQARDILKGTGKSFKTWIEEKFDFKYHTALNFINVYTVCSGQLELVRNVKPSVLYAISSKSFPEDLREVLIFENLLPMVNTYQLKKVYEDFKEKGFEAVKPLLEEKAKSSLVYTQTLQFVDNLKRIEHHVGNVLSSLQGNISRDDVLPDRKGATKIGDEINQSVFDFLKQKYSEIQSFSKDIDSKRDELFRNIVDQMQNTTSQ